MTNKLVKSCLFGVLGAIIISAVLLLVFNYICYINDDPDKYLGVLGVGALLSAAFFGGFISSRLNRESGLVCGLITGVLFVLLVILISFSMQTDANGMTTKSYLFFALVPIISAVAGLLGLPSKKKKKKKTGK